MTINSAQRLQRETTQCQAINEQNARTMVGSADVPTQIIDPTQRREDVRLHAHGVRLRLNKIGPKTWNFLSEGRE